MKKRVRRGDPERRAYWEATLRRWREGGQSVRAFCRAEGLRESAFYFWRRELSRRGLRIRKGAATVPAAHSSGPAFLPVHVVTPEGNGAGVAEAGRAPLGQRPGGYRSGHPRSGSAGVGSPVALVGSGRLAGSGVEIVLAHGGAAGVPACGSRVAVRVRAGFDRQTLRDVLAVLEDRPC
jgi:hypothetical protein